MRAFVLLSALLFTVNSQANYFKGGVGYSLGGETKFSGNSNASVDHKDQFLSPLLVAYAFEMTNEVYGEIEVAYRNNEYDVSGSSNTVRNKVLTAAFNLVGNVPLGVPVLTGGIGATFGRYADLANNVNDGTAFGVQAFGGLDFKIQDNVTIGGELRYMTTISKIDLGNGIDGEYTSTAVMFTFKSYL